jgi:hypothetical protein
LYQHNFLPQFLSYVSNIFAAYLGVFVPVVFNRLPSLCHMSQTDISRGWTLAELVFELWTSAEFCGNDTRSLWLRWQRQHATAAGSFVQLLSYCSHNLAKGSAHKEHPSQRLNENMQSHDCSTVQHLPKYSPMLQYFAV